MKFNEKAQQVIEYLLVVAAVVAGVLGVASPFKTAVEKSLNGAVSTIYGGYTWRTSGYTCTAAGGATCGLGTATQSVWCESINTGEPVGDAYCVSFGPKPPDSGIACDLGACGSANWVLGSWSTCTALCGGGSQFRTVECHDSGGALLSDASCPLPKPIDNQSCGSMPCYYFKAGGACIDLCSAVCGTGTCTQTITCTDNLTGLPAAAGNCTGLTPPSSTITCNTGLTCGYQWIARGWTGGCVTAVVGCGTGTQTQVVDCVNSSTGSIESDRTKCDASLEPPSSATCNLGPCYTWNLTGGWGPCSTPCDAGTQNAIVQCLDRASNVVSDSLCDPATKPSSTRACPSQPVCTYSWGNDAWTPCTPNCAGVNGGTQTRNVFCDRTFPPPMRMPDLTECRRVDPTHEPPASQVCTPVCVMWDATAWSACTNSCGSGTQSRTFFCRTQSPPITTVADQNCLDLVGPKPTTTSQTCTDTSSCCGNGSCAGIPAAGYVENCSTCNRDCFSTLCANDGSCGAGENCTNSATDCNVCPAWTNGACGVNASPACLDGQIRQTRTCSCSGAETRCASYPSCVFSCQGGLDANATECSGAKTGLTGNPAWTYAAACDGTKCQATCNSGYYASGATCLRSPTCTDGIQNGSETGVDCGGPCSPCCVPDCSTALCPGAPDGCGGTCTVDNCTGNRACSWDGNSVEAAFCYYGVCQWSWAGGCACGCVSGFCALVGCGG